MNRRLALSVALAAAVLVGPAAAADAATWHRPGVNAHPTVSLRTATRTSTHRAGDPLAFRRAYLLRHRAPAATSSATWLDRFCARPGSEARGICRTR